MSVSRIFKGAFQSLILKIGGYALSLLSTFLAARWLGVSEFGLFSFLLSWITLLGVPATLGLDKLIVREISIFHHNLDWNSIHALLKWTNLVTLISSICIAIVGGFAIYRLSNSTESNFLPIVVLSVASIPFYSVSLLRQESLVGLRQIFLAQMPQMILYPFLLIIIPFFIKSFISPTINALWMIISNFIAISIVMVIGILLLINFLPNNIREFKPKFSRRAWMKSAFPLMIYSSSAILYNRISTVLLGILSTSTDVGVFSVTNKCASTVIFVLAAMNSASAPIMSSLYSKGDIIELQKVVTRSTRAIFTTSLIVSLTLLIFGGELLTLFGPEYTSGIASLNILTVGQLINGSTGSVGCLLNMTGYERYSAITVLAGAILNFLLSFFLIKMYGANGAALATTISLSLINLINVYIARKVVGINTTVFSLRR